MGTKEGLDRVQSGIWSLEDMVAEESMVRVIDRYVEVLDLQALGFLHVEAASTGRPRYATQALTKLYIYGYENGIRSSRKLERETRRNVEVMWLLGGLTPDHKTISEFRRENIRPLQKLFQSFVKLCRSWELIGGELVAVDGAKIKASNNKKRNFSRKKLDERLKRLDEKIERYLKDLEEADQREDCPEAPKGLREALERKELYEQYLAQLDESGENEISLTDPDARLMGNNRGGVDMAYNVQTAVDGKNHMIMDYDVSLNPSDQGRLSYMTKRLIRQGHRKFYLLADKGYYSGEDLAKVKKYKVKAIVSRQKASDPKDQPEQFHNDKFIYGASSDTYTCPLGHTMCSPNKKAALRRNYFNKKACACCPHLRECARGGAAYRTVTRGKYGDVLDEADRLFRENLELYKLRQQIVEHPFGTIKHTMNGGYFLLRTRRKVRSEVALLCLGYNFKRAYNILGFQGLMARLKAASRLFAWAFGEMFHFLSQVRPTPAA